MMRKKAYHTKQVGQLRQVMGAGFIHQTCGKYPGRVASRIHFGAGNGFQVAGIPQVQYRLVESGTSGMRVH